MTRLIHDYRVVTLLAEYTIDNNLIVASFMQFSNVPVRISLTLHPFLNKTSFQFDAILET